MENKNFCIKPFNSIRVNTSGDIMTCCKISPSLSKSKNKSSFNLRENSVNDYWNSEYRNHVKDQFLKGDVPPECARCKEDEIQNIKSERQLANQHYGIIGEKTGEFYLKRLEKENLEHPEDYNLDITNLCNLKCQMCTGESSSKLLIENNALGIQKLDQKNYDVSEERLQRLISEIVDNNVTHITLQGGEPLMNPKILLLLEKLSTKELASRLSVWITTNGTQHTEKLHDTLSKFKEVKLIFSIDGVGKNNNYLRYPSKWADIENNVKKFKNLTNATYQITFVVQNLNVLGVPDIINFSKKYKIHLRLSLLYAPEYLQLHLLPKNLLKKALDNLETIDNTDTIHVTNFDVIKQKIQSALQDTKSTHTELNTLKEIIFKRDSYRKIHIKDYLPEIVKGLNILE
jgi:sulfatase maturation enzyme AslB (radical SAM superfamily)